jgi:hypothetical protein
VIRTVLVLPSPPALLPIRSLQDPVTELRAACAAAVAEVAANMDRVGRIVVLAGPVSEANRRRGVTVPLGHRVAEAVLGGRPFEPRVALPQTAAELRRSSDAVLLVAMADGSARRGERAPGHVHPAALDFDDCIERALRSGDAETLARLDPELGEELLSDGVPTLRVVGELARDREVSAAVRYAEAPYGVAWWVARWELT